MPDSRLVPQTEDRLAVAAKPILQQARQDLTEFSKAQVVPALAMGIGTFITAWVLGQITSWGSALLLVFGSVLVGVILYALLALVRAPFIVIAQHHRQLADVNQRLMEVESRPLNDPVFGPLLLPSPIDAVPAPVAASSIEFTDFVIVTRWVSEYGDVITNSAPIRSDAENFEVQIMLARLYYKPDRDLPSDVSIRAQVVITDSQGANLRARYDAVWDVNPISEYKTFSTADTHALTIAVLKEERGQGLLTYEYGFSDLEFRPTFTHLAGADFVLKVTLIGKIAKATVLNASMRFLLTLEPEPKLEPLDGTFS